MRQYFAHNLAVCAYLEDDDVSELRTWITWHRRRGVDFFYLYAPFDTRLLSNALNREINNGIGILFRVSGKDGAQFRLSVYKDCLERARYVCKTVAFLKVGEYLEQDGGASLAETVASQCSQGVGTLVLSIADEERYIIDPLLVGGLEISGKITLRENWRMKAAEKLSVTYRTPVKHIALLSHVMARNGAPLALLGAARILKEIGCEIDVYTMAMGPLKEKFEALGMRVIIDPILHGMPLVDQPWYKDYDLIFANTAVMCGCFRKPLDGAPVMWWLHESPSSLKWCRITKENLSLLCKDRITTFGVSEAANKAFWELRPDWPIAGCLPLGVMDAYAGDKNHIRKMQRPYIFMMIGSIEKNKGQDIFLQAIGKLSVEEREQCEFWMVGGKVDLGGGDAYCESIASIARKYPEVKTIDFQPHEKILKMYGEADVFVVPSREECLPTVAIEAMMMGMPCILSNSAGVTGYTTDGENAICFESENAGQLTEKMRMCINETDKILNIGEKGRMLYKKCFSVDGARKQLLDAINGCINSCK